jgi:hypothetical protein
LEEQVNKRLTSIFFVAISGVFLGGCGGGGDGGGAASTATFPAQAAYSARVAAGSTDNFTVAGTCNGTASMTNSPATAASFEGVTGFAVAQTITLSVTNCTPATNAISGTAYYDANYSPLGSSIPGVEYSKFLTPPPVLPASVKVGDTAVYSTQTTYTDSSKTVISGQHVLSYVIEADTANTAIANFITKTYNASSQLLSTQQSRYRITTSGAVTVVSIDVQYSTTSTTHLIYTKV